jgi:hypothetical protein
MKFKTCVILLGIILIGLPSSVALSQEKGAEMAALTIAEAVVCRGVEDRAPVGAGDVFQKDVQQVFCFVRVVGAQTETEIQHKWYHQDQLVATVSLPVKSDNWRTYSSKRIGPESTGEWMVEICTMDGVPLNKIIFLVE